MNPGLSVLVTPHDGPPYQELLYREVTAAGVQVRYTDGPTPSQTLNIFLGPAVLAWCRIRGSRILHIHWVFQFSLPWARQKTWARKLMEFWFGLYLRTASILGYVIVWTAHDILPHEQIFDDDLRATKLLISRAKAIVALSEATAVELRQLGARNIRVIPMGSYAIPYPVTLTTEKARSSFGFGDSDLVVLLIGRIEEYKGADLLLLASNKLPPTSEIKILMAGSCSNSSYRRKLELLASEAGTRVRLMLEWIPDADVARYLQAADFAAFPFREVTNSGSIRLAQSFGLPVIIPELTYLRDVPRDTAIRFDPEMSQGVEPLLEALQNAEHLSEAECLKMSDSALAWAAAALETIDTYKDACRRPH